MRAPVTHSPQLAKEGIRNEWPVLFPGDILLSRGNAFFARAIRWFGQTQTGAARVNHAAMVTGHVAGRYQLIEALGRIRVSPITDYDLVPVIIYRHEGIRLDQRHAIAMKALSLNSQGYGWTKIPLLALDALFRTYRFSQALSLTHFKVCSQLIAWAYEKKLDNTVFGPQGWRSTSPDAMDDYMWRHRPPWRIVHCTLDEGPTVAENTE